MTKEGMDRFSINCSDISLRVKAKAMVNDDPLLELVDEYPYFLIIDSERSWAALRKKFEGVALVGRRD